MPRGRPRKPQYVSMSEFARKCGLQLSQISTYAGGTNPRVIINEELKEIDIRNKVNEAFLETCKKKKDRDNALSDVDRDVRLKLAELMKAESDAQYKAVKAREALHDLIDKSVMESTFLAIGKTIRELLLPQGERVSPKICSLFENIDKKKIIEVQELVDNENGEVLDEIKKQLRKKIEENDFFNTLDDNELFKV